MNWAILLIAAATILFFIRELRKIRDTRLLRRRESAWPGFEEAYISALQSGISIAESFSFVADFEPTGLATELNELVADIDNGTSFEKSLRQFRKKVGFSSADLFVEIVLLANETGGNSLVQSLQNHVKEVRLRLSASGDVEARQNAILSVAKIGLLAPWILVAVLCVNEQTREAFNSTSGQMLLLGGFAISLIAYRMVIAAGSQASYQRIFGLADG